MHSAVNKGFFLRNRIKVKRNKALEKHLLNIPFLFLLLGYLENFAYNNKDIEDIRAIFGPSEPLNEEKR